MDELFSSLREHKSAGRDAGAALDAATPALIDACRQYDTGGGRRIRDIVWSLYGCHHTVNLGDALSNLDPNLSKAALAAVQARLFLGPDSEDKFRDILVQSGEMSRWAAAEKLTPEGQTVAYPPPPMSPGQMRRLAESVELTEKAREAQEARLSGRGGNRQSERGGRGFER